MSRSVWRIKPEANVEDSGSHRRSRDERVRDLAHLLDDLRAKASRSKNSTLNLNLVCLAWRWGLRRVHNNRIVTGKSPAALPRISTANIPRGRAP